jgi:hypothetical protein
MKKVYTFVIILLLGLSANIFSQTNTWTGNSDQNWNNTGNWSQGHVPTSGEDVVIPNVVTATIFVNTAAVCNSFTMNGGGLAVTVTISGTNGLTVTGAVSIGAGASSAANKVLSVGSGYLSCGSVNISATTNADRNSSITVSTGTVTVYGNITMGDTNDLFTFTGSGTLNVSGDMSGGTFTASTSTVSFNGYGNPQLVGSYTYNNLNLAGGGSKTVSGVTVNGILTMQGTATTSAAPTYGASSSLVYSGSSGQVTGPEFLSSMSRPVTINNSNGVTLNGSKTLNNTLTFISGNLYTTGSYTLTLGSSGTLSGEAADRYLVGNLSVTMNVGSGLSTMGNIGITLLIGADVGTVTVNRVSGTAPTGSGHKLNRSWAITSSVSASRNITLTWVSNDDGNVDLSQAIAYLSTDNGTNWGLVSSSQDVSSSRSITTTGVSLSGTSSLLTVSDAATPLPVELTSFTASVSNGTVNLKWETVTEVNTYGFDVERSVDNKTWTKIGFVAGAGNSNSPKNYSFADQPDGRASFSYRLKQIDVGGAYKYYDPITVSLSGGDKAQLMQNSPNPFNPSTAIKYYIPQAVDVTITIYDILGRVVTKLVNSQVEAGYHVVYWNGRDRFGNAAASSVYIYRLTAGSFTEIKKMNLLK